MKVMFFGRGGRVGQVSEGLVHRLHGPASPIKETLRNVSHQLGVRS
jgi:hypothetical protein